MDYTGKCMHGWTRLQGCRECSPRDWREERDALVYGAAERGAAVHAAVERDLSNPSPDPDAELNRIPNL